MVLALFGEIGDAEANWTWRIRLRLTVRCRCGNNRRVAPVWAPLPRPVGAAGHVTSPTPWATPRGNHDPHVPYACRRFQGRVHPVHRLRGRDRGAAGGQDRHRLLRPVLVQGGPRRWGRHRGPGRAHQRQERPARLHLPGVREGQLPDPGAEGHQGQGHLLRRRRLHLRLPGALEGPARPGHGPAEGRDSGDGRRPRRVAPVGEVGPVRGRFRSRRDAHHPSSSRGSSRTASCAPSGSPGRSPQTRSP